MSADLLRRAATVMRERRAHPALLAVADWLEGRARDLDSADGHLSRCDSPEDTEYALGVARAYLGES